MRNILLVATLLVSVSTFAADIVGKRTLNEPVMVNFAAGDEYTIKAKVVVASVGETSWHYDSSEESIKVTVEINGKSVVFPTNLKGRVLGMSSDIGDEDAGVYIEVLEPLVVNGQKETIHVDEDFSEYIKHVVKSYRLEFTSPKKGAFPTKMDVAGPISNLAG